MTIPKIIHQIWLPDFSPPSTIMETWQDNHPDYEYILWDVDRINEESDIFDKRLLEKSNSMETNEGKVACLMWGILKKYGGVYVDVNCRSVVSISHLINRGEAFACYDNERVMGAGWSDEYTVIGSDKYPMLCTNVIAVPAEHDLVKTAIVRICENPVTRDETTHDAWVTVGAGLFTKLYHTKFADDFHIFPSYYFNPRHSSGLEYTGHGRVYAYKSHDSDLTELPAQYTEPIHGVSILIISNFTAPEHIRECIDSIIEQAGYLKLQIVWVERNNHPIVCSLIQELLNNLKHESRFVSSVYIQMPNASTYGESAKMGIDACVYDIVVRQEPADIMVDTRVLTQFEVMYMNPHADIIGGQTNIFEKSTDEICRRSDYSSHTKTLHLETSAFRKNAIIRAGSYNPQHELCLESEMDMINRMIRQKSLVSIGPDTLVYHRFKK